MGSSLLNLFGGGNNGVNDFLAHLNEFNNFRNNFKGNPQEAGEKLLQSGQMS